MNILFVSSEVAPFSKTGGLADVAGALPAALAELGHTVKVVSPLYQMVNAEGLTNTGKQIRLRFPYGVEIGGVESAEDRADLASFEIADEGEVLRLRDRHDP